jgi:hypothetical protein
MPPPLSTRVCGEFSGQGERVLRRRKREEEEDWRESVGEPGCGICLGADYKAERYSAREAMLLGVGAWGTYFSLSISLLLVGPLFSLNSFSCLVYLFIFIFFLFVHVSCFSESEAE